MDVDSEGVHGVQVQVHLPSARISSTVAQVYGLNVRPAASLFLDEITKKNSGEGLILLQPLSSCMKRIQASEASTYCSSYCNISDRTVATSSESSNIMNGIDALEYSGLFTLGKRLQDSRRFNVQRNILA